MRLLTTTILQWSAKMLRFSFVFSLQALIYLILSLIAMAFPDINEYIIWPKPSLDVSSAQRLLETIQTSSTSEVYSSKSPGTAAPRFYIATLSTESSIRIKNNPLVGNLRDQTKDQCD